MSLSAALLPRLPPVPVPVPPPPPPPPPPAEPAGRERARDGDGDGECDGECGGGGRTRNLAEWTEPPSLPSTARATRAMLRVKLDSDASSESCAFRLDDAAAA